MSLQANVCNVSATPNLHNTSDDTMGFWGVFGGVFVTGVLSYAWFSQLGTKDATQREEIASKERIRNKEMDIRGEEIASKERIQREEIAARREENATKERIAWMRIKVDLELANGADSSQRRHRIHSHGSQDNFLATEPQGSRVKLLD